MGVPLARRALKGGWSTIIRDSTPSDGMKNIFDDEDDTYTYFYIGKPLTQKVAHFIAIQGPNFGVKNCTEENYAYYHRSCDRYQGYNPGSAPGEPFPKDMSFFLQELNSD